MKRLFAAGLMIFCVSTLGLVSGAEQNERARLDEIERSLKGDVPRLLCLTEEYATAAQPSEKAFSKLAANGFRSVLNLRTGNEGADLDKERRAVEESGMRYFNIPVVSSAPRPEQADEFIRLIKEKPNHPMLIHCGTANRVGAFMMIYRVVEQGWAEQTAFEEAVRIGLTSEGLKNFAHEYIAKHTANRS